MPIREKRCKCTFCWICSDFTVFTYEVGLFNIGEECPIHPKGYFNGVSARKKESK